MIRLTGRAGWIGGALGVLSAAGALWLTLGDAAGHQIDFDIYRMGGDHLFGSDLYAVRLSRALMGGSLGMPSRIRRSQRRCSCRSTGCR